MQAGRFGACLMAEPELVADLIAAMGESCKVPVTVKCRIGIDDQDAEESLDRFIDAVAEGGCRTFILHARKAWLEGLSPKENRDVPPIDYDRVYRMKARRPDLTIIVNGGIGSFAEAADHLAHVDGVMLGRAAYQDPYILAEVDQRLFGAEEPAPSRLEVLDSFMAYAEGRACPRRASQSDDAPHPRPVPRPAARASLPPGARRERASRWRGPRRAQGCAQRCCR